MRAGLIVVAALVAIGASVWVWQASREGPVRSNLAGANVLLVTIDTLRADQAGAYGSESGLTPASTRSRRSGVRFTHAWSHAPVTLPAHASILTGLLPPNHGVRNNGAFRLGSGPTTLANACTRPGTARRVSSARSSWTPGLASTVGSTNTTIATTLERCVRELSLRRTSCRSRAASGDCRGFRSPQAGDARPWFAWVHLFDPHAPYQAPPAFRT